MFLSKHCLLKQVCRKSLLKNISLARYFVEKHFVNKTLPPKDLYFVVSFVRQRVKLSKERTVRKGSSNSRMSQKFNFLVYIKGNYTPEHLIGFSTFRHKEEIENKHGSYFLYLYISFYWLTLCFCTYLSVSFD